MCKKNRCSCEVFKICSFVMQALKLLMQCNYDASEALQRLQVDSCPQSGAMITLFHFSLPLCGRIVCFFVPKSVHFCGSVALVLELRLGMWFRLVLDGTKLSRNKVAYTDTHEPRYICYA